MYAAPTDNPAPKLVLYKHLENYGITYGPDYVRKLVAEGRFPAPIKLSRALRAWREEDILNWSAEKMGAVPGTEEHETSAAAKRWANHVIQVVAGRLVSYDALPVSYSRQHLLRLEKAGLFPKRVYLSPRRIAWSAEAVEAWLAARAKPGKTLGHNHTAGAL